MAKPTLGKPRKLKSEPVPAWILAELARSGGKRRKPRSEPVRAGELVWQEPDPYTEKQPDPLERARSVELERRERTVPSTLGNAVQSWRSGAGSGSGRVGAGGAWHALACAACGHAQGQGGIAPPPACMR